MDVGGGVILPLPNMFMCEYEVPEDELEAEDDEVDEKTESLSESDE